MAAQLLEMQLEISNSAHNLSGDPEMIEAVSVYIDCILEDNAASEVTSFWIEHRFDLSKHIAPGMFGTADYVSYSSKENLLRVYDFKYGQGIPVEAKNNQQLKYYALGALLDTFSPADFVELVIVQPRCPHPDGPVRRFEMTAMELELDFRDELTEAVKRTKDPDAPLKSGDHCRFCPAAGICPELSKESMELAKTEFSPLFSYDPNQLSKALQYLPRIEAWIKSVREFAYNEALGGRTPPGFKLVEKRATRKWARDELEVRKLISPWLEDEDIYDQKIKSPAQIEKILKIENFDAKEILKPLVVSVSSGTTLVSDSDKRKAVNDAALDFDLIEGEK